MAPSPDFSTTESPPFPQIGIDFAGPSYIRRCIWCLPRHYFNPDTRYLHEFRNCCLLDVYILRLSIDGDHKQKCRRHGVESGVAQWTWRRQNGAESGVVKRCRRQASSTKASSTVASSTVASSKGVVERRRQQALSTVASRMASSGIEWRQTKSNDVEWRQMTSNGIEWHRMTSNAIEWHRMLVEYSSNSRRKWRDKILNQNWWNSFDYKRQTWRTRHGNICQSRRSRPRKIIKRATKQFVHLELDGWYTLAFIEAKDTLLWRKTFPVNNTMYKCATKWQHWQLLRKQNKQLELYLA